MNQSAIGNKSTACWNFVRLIGMSNDGFHNFQRREIYFYKGSWYVKWRTPYFVKKVASSTVRFLILKTHVLEDHVRESQGSKLAFSKGRVWYGQIYSISRARGHLTHPRAEILFQSGKSFFHEYEAWGDNLKPGENFFEGGTGNLPWNLLSMQKRWEVL